MELFLNGLFGVIIGFVGGYAGIGGAPLLIFLLGTFLSYPQHLAQGTVVAIMLGPMSLGGVIAHWVQVKQYWKHILIGVFTYAIFSYFGAWIAYLFSSATLRLLFGGLLFVLGLRYMCQKERPIDEGPAELRLWPMTILGSVVGVIGGLFGIGAGVLLVPLLIMIFKVPKDDARAISLAILLLPVSLGAVIKYQGSGDILWSMVLVGFLGYLVSNYAGARLGMRHRPRHFQLIMGSILLICAVLYIGQTLVCFVL